MYGLRVNITPSDIIDKLSDEDKARFNQCVFTDIRREFDGSITIDCVVFDDPDPYTREKHKQRYCDSNLKVEIPRPETINETKINTLRGKKYDMG
jgi:hypothetical protein